MKRKAAFASLVFASAGLVAPASAHGTRCGQPFQHFALLTLRTGVSNTDLGFKVPEGKQLQIEYVSAAVRLPSTESRSFFGVGTTAGGVFGWHPLPSQPSHGPNERQTSAMVSLYADGGTTVMFDIGYGSSPDADVLAQYTVTGCLFDASET